MPDPCLLACFLFSCIFPLYNIFVFLLSFHDLFHFLGSFTSTFWYFSLRLFLFFRGNGEQLRAKKQVDGIGYDFTLLLECMYECMQCLTNERKVNYKLEEPIQIS